MPLLVVVKKIRAIRAAFDDDDGAAHRVELGAGFPQIDVLISIIRSRFHLAGDERAQAAHHFGDFFLSEGLHEAHRWIAGDRFNSGGAHRFGQCALSQIITGADVQTLNVLKIFGTSVGRTASSPKRWRSSCPSVEVL